MSRRRVRVALDEPARACPTTSITRRSRPRTWTRGWPGHRLRPFIKLARTRRKHRAGILAAIRLGLSNGRRDGLNSNIHPISHHAVGLHSPTP